jgi:hypothetical protein
MKLLMENWRKLLEETEPPHYTFSDEVKEHAEDIFELLDDAGDNEADFLQKFEAFVKEYKEGVANAPPEFEPDEDTF